MESVIKYMRNRVPDANNTEEHGTPYSKLEDTISVKKMNSTLNPNQGNSQPNNENITENQNDTSSILDLNFKS
jgi:hypothetical protein